MGVEDHRQGFAAALRMPENTALAVGGRRNFRLFNCASHSKVLMIACQNFDWLWVFVGKQNEIPNDVQKAFTLEYAFIEGIELGKMLLMLPL